MHGHHIEFASPLQVLNAPYGEKGALQYPVKSVISISHKKYRTQKNDLDGRMPLFLS